MKSLIDSPLLLPVAALVILLAALHVFLSRRRALGFLETAVLMAVASVALIALGIAWFEYYGWVLFVLWPFLIGVGAVVLYRRNGPPRTFGRYVAVGSSVLGLVGVGLILVAVEGGICLVMAFPMAYALMLLGIGLTYRRQARFLETPAAPALLLLLPLLAPLLMGAEASVPRRPPVYRVHTTVEIDAPPEVVWRNVVSFRELPPPDDWLFHTGLAYPVRAEIRGRGVGAIRTCQFSTGPFVEPIEVWDEPRLLRFTVTSNPPSLQELSPYGAIHPPHVQGFLVSKQGQFRLVRLPGGRTRLEGTTWYQHGLYPAGYWRLWSDWIIHRIHLRVLEHVKRLSEEEARGVAL